MKDPSPSIDPFDPKEYSETILMHCAKCHNAIPVIFRRRVANVSAEIRGRWAMVEGAADLRPICLDCAIHLD